MKRQFSLVMAVIYALLIWMSIPAASVLAADDWYENWDSYDVGASVIDMSDWEAFWGYGQDSYISDAQSRSANNALYMNPSAEVPAYTDVIHPISGYDSGQWVFTVYQFIPNDFNGDTRIHVLNKYSSAGVDADTDYSLDVRFNETTGKVTDNNNGTEASLDLVKGEWSEFRVEIDLDYVNESLGQIGWQKVYYRGDLLYEYQWNSNSESCNSIGAIELYCIGGEVYYDDLSLVGESTNRAPSIRTQPSDQTVLAGQTASFTATAIGYPTPTVQWQVMPVDGSWSDIVGATSATYDVSATWADDGNQYRAIFHNDLGDATSDPALLTLAEASAPEFTNADHVAFRAESGGSFTFTTNGFPVPSITLTSGDLPSGVTYNSNTKTLSGTPATDTGGSYPLVFTASNGVSPDATQNFTFSVNVWPEFTNENNTAFTVGTAGSFTFTTSGYPTAVTVTLDSGSLPSGVTFNSSTKTLSGTPAVGTGGSYSLGFIAANGITPNGSQNFTLNVSGPPVITVQPLKQTVVIGATATFTFGYRSYPAANLQWQVSTNNGKTWNNIEGANSESYTTPSTTNTMNRNLYRVVLTNGVGWPITSNKALLTVKNK